MSELLVPSSEAEAANIVRGLAAAHRPVAIRGGGSRSGLGRPLQVAATLSTAGLSGITLYEPAEMVLSARAGTPMAEIEATLARHGQMLAFEPMDHRRLFATRGEPTIGGLVAANASGPRRIAAGGVRDSLLGARFVNGRGEVIKSGGRVMKNVTGLDLARLSCGAYGSLGLLTELTFRLLPKPPEVATLVLLGLSDKEAVTALTTAMTSYYRVSGAAHLPQLGPGEPGHTLLRLVGSSDSVQERMAGLKRLFNAQSDVLDAEGSAEVWAQIRDVGPLAALTDAAIWRVSLKPTIGPDFVLGMAAWLNLAWYYDWSGGLIWLATPMLDEARQESLRADVARLGGHATLIRRPRSAGPWQVFPPLAPAIRTLTLGIKEALDPLRLLNPGIMYEGV
jgi:glycolate oxidase FAD binding subunit